MALVQKRIHSKVRMIVCITIIYTTTACKELKNIPPNSSIAKSNCNQHLATAYSEKDLPQPIHKIDIDTALNKHFSFQSLHIAHAFGLLENLASFLRMKKEYQAKPTLEKKIELLEISQKINQRIHIASLEIAALASEMDCEEERADQVATYLKNKENNNESQLTVGAIVVGAVGAIITGTLLANENAGKTPELIGVTTGLTEAILGVLILLNQRKVQFYHPRNALKDVWKAPATSTIFPSSVWYYFNYEKPNSPEKSLRQQLVDKWIGFGQIADLKEKNKEKVYNLFFGNGGKYTAEQLTNRANMYDQVEAFINLMKQDLKLLAIEFEQLNHRE